MVFPAGVDVVRRADSDRPVAAQIQELQRPGGAHTGDERVAAADIDNARCLEHLGEACLPGRGEVRDAFGLLVRRRMVRVEPGRRERPHVSEAVPARGEASRAAPDPPQHFRHIRCPRVAPAQASQLVDRRR